jgi:hypothetical protein
MSDFLVTLLNVKVATIALEQNVLLMVIFCLLKIKVLSMFLVSYSLINTTQLKQNIVHHISCLSDSYSDVIDRISSLNLRYSINQVSDSSRVKIFVLAPESLIIEIQAVPPT